MKTSTAAPVWLRAGAMGRPAGVDRAEQVIRGYVVAQRGRFRDRHAEFTDESLSRIVDLMGRIPGGLKSRFTHPTVSDDGLGKFLGRARNGRIDDDRVRADLHLDPTSRKTPSGDLGGYVLDLAESDPAALSSSLVLTVEKIKRLDDNGKPARDEQGEPLPDIWMPTQLHASDIVDEGAAVDGLLSVDLDLDHLAELPRYEHAKLAAQFLDRQFPHAEPEVIRAKANEWLERYLAWRFGLADQAAISAADLASVRRRLRARS